MYCSPKCRSLEYYYRHHEKLKTINREFAKLPKQKKNKHTLRLKKYGLTEDEYDSLLLRQNNKCQICKEGFTSTPNIDHDHATSIVRGLLCTRCNLMLGRIEDKKAILTNMVAYLDRDVKKKYVYLIGSLANESIPLVGNEFRKQGYVVYDHWWGAGKEADKSWQEYSKIKGLTYKEALKDVGAQTVFHFDRSRIEMSDICILVMPAGKSGHLELGYAAGLNKKTYILYEGEPDRYDVMPQFAKNGVFYKLEDLLSALADEEESTDELAKPANDLGNRNLLPNRHLVPVCAV